MKKTISQLHIGTILLCAAIILGIWLFRLNLNLLLYWLLGLGFGFILQRFMICFVSTTSDPILLGSTERFRAILIGILVTSFGITIVKYLSCGTVDMLGVSAISLPLMLGAFLFGIGMILAGCCSSGMFIRLAEGYTVHIITFICVVAGYLLAQSHYQSLWAPFITKAPLIFLPKTFGWVGGISVHIAIILVLYVSACKYEQRTSRSDNSTYLKGTLLLAVLTIFHFILLKNIWSVTGAFFWIHKIPDILSEVSSAISTNNDTYIIAIGANIRNFGLFVGALISVLFSARFHFKKIRSKKQICKSIVGGLLMGYGACIAGGCNISAFFGAATALSLSAWVFMIFLFAGAFAGIKILYKFL